MLFIIINRYNVLLVDGDWGLGPIPNPQSPIPTPQSPIPNPQSPYSHSKITKLYKVYFRYLFLL